MPAPPPLPTTTGRQDDDPNSRTLGGMERWIAAVWCHRGTPWPTEMFSGVNICSGVEPGPRGTRNSEWVGESAVAIGERECSRINRRETHKYER